MRHDSVRVGSNERVFGHGGKRPGAGRPRNKERSHRQGSPVKTYTHEQRRIAIRRYKEKRNRRMIDGVYYGRGRYEGRSQFAKMRPRSGGRFVSMYTKAKVVVDDCSQGRPTITPTRLTPTNNVDCELRPDIELFSYIPPVAVIWFIVWWPLSPPPPSLFPDLDLDDIVVCK